MSNDVKIKLYQEYGTTGTPVINLTQCTAEELSRLHSVIGGGISVPAPSVRWHSANGAAPRVVDYTPQNKTAVYRLIAKPSNTLTANEGDAINDAIIQARQLLNIAERRLEDETGRILLSVRRKNSTNVTIHEVIYGVVDDEQSHYDAAGAINNIAMGVFLRLTLKPFGETETGGDFSDKVVNILNADPTFTLDSDGDGLADGWNGHNTASENLYYWGWVGGLAQTVTGDGTPIPLVYSDWGNAHASGNLTAKLLIKNPAAGLRVRLRVQTNGGDTTAGVELRHDDSTSVSIKKYNDGVNDWYLVQDVLMGTSGTTTQARLLIDILGNNYGTATFDRAQLWET